MCSEHEAARAYVEAEAGKLRVFRCRKCGVWVAQEAKACGERPSVARGNFRATFTRTSSLVKGEDSVCCVRCGQHQFAWDDRDPALLTLPLFDEDGAQAFDKTALRCIFIFEVGEAGNFLNTRQRDARQKLHAGLRRRLRLDVRPFRGPDPPNVPELTH